MHPSQVSALEYGKPGARKNPSGYGYRYIVCESVLAGCEYKPIRLHTHNKKHSRVQAIGSCMYRQHLHAHMPHFAITCVMTLPPC